MNSILNNIDAIMQYIILYGPTVVAVIGSISTIIVAIKKCGQIKEDSAVETRKLKSQMLDNQKAMGAIIRENVELKKQMSEILSDIHKVYRGK